MKVLEKIVVSS